MTDETLQRTLNHFLTKFKTIRSDQSNEILEQLTLAQYKNLAAIDVRTNNELFQSLQTYLEEYLEVQNLEVALKIKKCALAGSLKQLENRFMEAAEETNNRNKKLRSDDIEFLKPMVTVPKPVFAKPAVPEQPVAPMVEPTYSMRVMREKVIQPVAAAIDEIMKPPTFSSNVKFSKTTKTQKVESFSLDDSLIDNDISIISDENFQRKLKFDDIDDDERDKTPARVRKVVKTPGTARKEPKTLDLSSMPPPPVFSSTTGRKFNQH